MKRQSFTVCGVKWVPQGSGWTVWIDTAFIYLEPISGGYRHVSSLWASDVRYITRKTKREVATELLARAKDRVNQLAAAVEQIEIS